MQGRRLVPWQCLDARVDDEGGQASKQAHTYI
jgi:hypothetical protein